MFSDLNNRIMNKRPPEAVPLSWINKALAPFSNSSKAVDTIIVKFALLVGTIDNECRDPSNHYTPSSILDSSQEIERDLRNPQSASYRDPELLQVAQVLVRLDTLQVWQELSCKMTYSHGPPFQIWEKRTEDKYYSIVIRGRKLPPRLRDILPDTRRTQN
jgi:hypothetical protein